MSRDVVVLIARSPSEADLVCAILRDAGIPAHSPSSEGWDGYSIARKMMNADLEIRVPAELAEKARRLIEEARDQGQD
ncbi:MAG: hypothetical protein RL885_17475 [Planctomycetota bacterium]